MKDFQFSNTGDFEADVTALHDHIVERHAYAKTHPDSTIAVRSQNGGVWLFSNNSDERPVPKHYQYSKSVQLSKEQHHNEVIERLEKTQQKLTKAKEQSIQLKQDYSEALEQGSTNIENLEKQLTKVTQQIETLTVRTESLVKLSEDSKEALAIWAATTRHMKAILREEFVKREKENFLKKVEEFRPFYQRVIAQHLPSWSERMIKEQLLSKRLGSTELLEQIDKEFEAQIH